MDLKKSLIAAATLLLPFTLQAADLDNGKKLSRSCALCHGQYMQGVAGDLYPRLLASPGNAAAGKSIYIEEECYRCHMKDGSGKAKKDIPPLKGQHTSYLLKQLQDFKAIARIHDGEDEKEDSSFAEMNETMFSDLVAYLSTLDD